MRFRKVAGVKPLSGLTRFLYKGQIIFVWVVE